jgi:hypothetical protein
LANTFLVSIKPYFTCVPSILNSWFYVGECIRARMVLFLGGPCAIWGGAESPVSALSKTVNDSRTGLSDSTPPICREANYELTSRTAAAVSANSASIHRCHKYLSRLHLVYSMCVMSRSCIIPPVVRLLFTLFCFYFPTTNKPMGRTRIVMKRGPNFFLSL